MPLWQDVRVRVPPALLGRFLGELQQLLAVAATHRVEIQEPRNVGGLQATSRQFLTTDLGFGPSQALPNVIGRLAGAGAKATELGGKTPSPHGWASLSGASR